MSKTTTPAVDDADAGPLGLDLSAYTSVTILKADEVDGHVYRRGTTHMVDAATLAVLLERKMIEAPIATKKG